MHSKLGKCKICAKISSSDANTSVKSAHLEMVSLCIILYNFCDRLALNWLKSDRILWETSIVTSYSFFVYDCLILFILLVHRF